MTTAKKNDRHGLRWPGVRVPAVREWQAENRLWVVLLRKEMIHKALAATTGPGSDRVKKTRL